MFPEIKGPSCSNPGGGGTVMFEDRDAIRTDGRG